MTPLSTNKKAKPDRLLPEVGSFETDIAEKVLGAKLCSNNIIVTIDWEVREDGKKPKPS